MQISSEAIITFFFGGEFITVLDTGDVKNLVHYENFKALPERLWWITFLTKKKIENLIGTYYISFIKK